MRCLANATAAAVAMVLAGWSGWLPAAEEAPASDPAAEKMMIAAHQARAGWDESFPGFSAELTVYMDGTKYEGTATVDADGGVEVVLPDEAARRWAGGQLESIAMHRFASVRDRYDVSFADQVTTHPLGRLIRFHGGSTHSLYRIRDDLITEVHRTMDEVKFTITVTHVVRNAEGKYLPVHFNVCYWDRQSGQLKSTDDFEDGWRRVGRYDLPASRLLVRSSSEGRRVYQLQLDHHKLLAGEAPSR